MLLRRMPQHKGGAPVHGTGTTWSAPKLLLIPHFLPAVLILQLAQQHLALPRWSPTWALSEPPNCLTSVIVGTGVQPSRQDINVRLVEWIRHNEVIKLLWDDYWKPVYPVMMSENLHKILWRMKGNKILDFLCSIDLQKHVVINMHIKYSKLTWFVLFFNPQV